MFKITITPYFRPRRRYGFWAGEFETVPSINVLRRAVQADAEAMKAGLEAGTIEATEENLFISNAVHPKCFLVLEVAGKLPQPVKDKMRINTVISDEKTLGSIAIK